MAGHWKDDASMFDEMNNRDLASPQFVSWSARREAKHLVEVVSHLYPDGQIKQDALNAFELICKVDDAIEALS